MPAVRTTKHRPQRKENREERKQLTDDLGSGEWWDDSVARADTDDESSGTDVSAMCDSGIASSWVGGSPVVKSSTRSAVVSIGELGTVCMDVRAMRSFSALRTAKNEHTCTLKASQCEFQS